MAKSKVYYVDMKAKDKNNNLINKLSQLFYKAGFDELIEKDDLFGIKLHFGEEGNTGFIRPVFIRRLVEEIKKSQGKPFLTDANTLYVGTRANSIDHLNTAIANGFGYSTVQAPLVIADGLNGKNYREVEINQKHFDRVRIGSEICDADGILSVAHFKGHELTGFGGSIKNVGMGLGSRSGKQQMHAVVTSEITVEDCIACGKCAEWCPEDAFEIDDVSELNTEKCVGCGECMVTCPTDAIGIELVGESQEDMQERMTEYALGVIKDKEDKTGYINFVMDVSPLCDCVGWSDRPIVDDIGILASKDPVAIDQASADLINKQPGRKDSALKHNHGAGEDKFKGIHPEVDWTAQLAHGETIGLGSRDYELIKVD
ncbi:DUF362 domain-containing protein [Selenihalanaerobacter shriftii]|uniref:Ferredoxin n=1 Tax=Selenihalanaerobacter shriftii TaxID=142842 RepID=A0A1T4JMA9_9FIRM|nr:DUF362 domain-containing protein [Selenihalanaerobacter shriftii]SJZ31293.1 hypothetical protein SAMN02745118_00196 [Selenihalanaerobacter shriftii]